MSDVSIVHHAPTFAQCLCADAIPFIAPLPDCECATCMGAVFGPTPPVFECDCGHCDYLRRLDVAKDAHNVSLTVSREELERRIHRDFTPEEIQAFRDSEETFYREQEERERARAEEVLPLRELPELPKDWTTLTREFEEERRVFERERMRRQREIWAAKDAEIAAAVTPDDYTGFVAWADEVDTTPGPALLETSDGGMVLPAGKVSWIYGLPASGKSWTGIIAAHNAVLRGGRALIVDQEDTQATFQTRALQLGFDVRLYADDIRWAESDLMEHPKAVESQRQWLTGAVDPEMNYVLLDAAESTGAPSDGSDVNPWLNKVVAPWKGSCTAIVDHIPKQSEGRPAGPIGSNRKLAAVDGIALLVTGIPWTRNKSGKINLTCEKDRTGVYAKDEPVATITGTWAEVGDGQKAFNYTIDPPEEQPEKVSMSDKVLAVIVEAGPDGIMGIGKLRGMVRGNNGAVDSAVIQLENDGYITVNTAGTAKLFTATVGGFERVNG